MSTEQLQIFPENNRSRAGNKIGGSQIHALRKHSSRYNGLSQANLDALNRKKGGANVMNITDEYQQPFPGNAII